MEQHSKTLGRHSIRLCFEPTDLDSAGHYKTVSWLCKNKKTCQPLYHLESRWRNSHVLVYHGPLLRYLWGVAPSTFTTHLASSRCQACSNSSTLPTSSAPRLCHRWSHQQVVQNRRGWAPTSYKWPYEWVMGVIPLLKGIKTSFITGRGPPCIGEVPLDSHEST